MIIQDRIEEIEKKNIEEVEYHKERVKAKVVIINTNPEDEPSERYIRNKVAKLNSYGIETEVIYATYDFELINAIKLNNENKEVTGIIVQAPLGKAIKINPQYFFDLVDPYKDIDRLHSKWYYSKDRKNLPLTALGMYKLLKTFPTTNKILFIGNGLTTNKRLYLKMFDEGKYDVRIMNSKTPEDSRKELISWADIIVAATGIPESLECRNKIVISPTIAKTEDGFRSDLKQECRDYCLTHKVIGAIGKLTVSELLRRAYEDAVEQL